MPTGIPFHHVPVTPETKEAAEREQQRLPATGIDLVVLARAVAWHAEDRVVVDGDKTVVFRA